MFVQFGFWENKVEKNWANNMLHHMLDRKKKNIILPYSESITIILFTMSITWKNKNKNLCA